mmetsp:Transcript_32807/g.82682  ORF Transcript_32807/g.82682 Transcript_32807/m.82682 type:complete len:397 (+) Transcript_32807:455-1645(+)
MKESTRSELYSFHSLGGFGGVLLGFLLRDGVEACARDGDCGRYGARGSHGVAEDGDGGDDDDDALDGVGHGVRERGELGQRLVRGLVVQVVEHGAHEEVAQEADVEDTEEQDALGLQQSGGGGERLTEGGPLHQERGWQEHDAGHDGDAGIQVDAAQADLVLHVLGGDPAQSARHVRRHGEQKRKRGEAHLRGRSSHYAADDGNESKPHQLGVARAEEDGEEDDGARGLGSLDHLHEGHRGEVVRRARGDVGDEVQRRRGNERLHVRLGQASLGGLEDANLPADEHEDRADSDLDPREQPRVGEAREGLLVHDGKDGVEEEPAGDGPCHAEGLSLIILGGAGGGGGGGAGGDDVPIGGGGARGGMIGLTSTSTQGETDSPGGEEGCASETNAGRRC